MNNPLQFLSVIFLLMSVAPMISHAQQSCFQVFSGETGPTISCSDAFYSVSGNNSGGTGSIFDSNHGVLQSTFNGENIFDSEFPLPPNLVLPFNSQSEYNPVMIGNEISAFEIKQRLIASFLARQSDSQSASVGNRSRFTFIPFTTNNSTDPVDVSLEANFDFTLADPSDNTGLGRALAGAEITISGENGGPLVDFGGLAELDLDFDAEPMFFEEFEGSGIFSPSEPGIDDEFDIDIEFDTTFQATPGEPLTLDTGSFGSIFTDGFESGDTSAWSVTSPNTFVTSISSSNPNVRFEIVTDTSDFLINAGLNDAWVSADAPFQGFFFTVFPDTNFFFLSWFTFDSEPPTSGSAVFGAIDQRWVTGGGIFSGDSVTINVELTSGGLFNASDPVAVQQPGYGTITVKIINCNEAMLSYNFPSLGLSGSMTLTRVLTDNVALCETLAAG